MTQIRFNAEGAVSRAPHSFEHVGLRPGEALRRVIAIINYSAESHIDRYAMAHLAELAPCLAMIDVDAVDSADNSGKREKSVKVERETDDLLQALRGVGNLLKDRPDIAKAISPLMGPAEHEAFARADAAIRARTTLLDTEYSSVVRDADEISA